MAETNAKKDGLGLIKFELELTLAPGTMPDEAEAALRQAGAWAGRMVQHSLPAEMELIRWHIPSIPCVQTATLYRKCDWAAAITAKATGAVL